MSRPLPPPAFARFASFMGGAVECSGPLCRPHSNEVPVWPNSGTIRRPIWAPRSPDWTCNPPAVFVRPSGSKTAHEALLGFIRLEKLQKRAENRGFHRNIAPRDEEDEQERDLRCRMALACQSLIGLPEPYAPNSCHRTGRTSGGAAPEACPGAAQRQARRR